MRRISKTASIMEKLIYISLCVVLLILPFQRGSFFEKEIMPMELAIYSIFIVWTIYKIIQRQSIQLNSFMAIGMCILAVAYMLPAFLGYAANKTDAVNYVMRYAAYLAVFLIASDITKTKNGLKVWIYTIAVLGMAVAFLGIDSLAGGQIGTNLKFFDIGLNQYMRLNGVFQYANTTGMVLGMIFFVLLAVSILSDYKLEKIICSGFMFVALSGLMLTVSRGAIILMPLVYIALLILIPDKSKKIELVLTTVAPILISLILYQPFQKASPVISPDAGSVSKVWTLAIIGIVVAAIVTFLLLLLTNLLNKVSEKVYNIAFISLIALVILAVAGIWFTGAYTKIIPQQLLDRFTSGQGTSGRTDFYRDGFRVLKDRWLLGAGGGAWNSLYRTYQSYDYGSTEAHNLLLQVWIETGLIGIIAFIVVILAALKTYYDSRKAKENTDVSILILAITIYAIGHSMIDFNFSYFSIPVMIFLLLGALDGIVRGNESDTILSKFTGLPLIATVAGISFLAINICFIVARGYAVSATDIIRQAQEEATKSETNISLEALTQASEKLQSATKLNPWNVSFYIMETKPDADIQVDLDTLYTNMEKLGKKDKEILTLHYEAIMKATKLNSKNPIINIMAAQFMLNQLGDIESGLNYMDNGLKYNPMAYGRYEEAANAYYEAGRVTLESGKKEQAQKYLQRVLEIENDVAKVNQRALKPVTLSENTLIYIQKAKELLATIV